MELGNTSPQWCVWELGTFKLIFFFLLKFSSVQIFSVGTQPTWDCWPQAGLLLTLEEMVWIRSWLWGSKAASSLERKTMTASTGLPGICYVPHEMALITSLFPIFKYSLTYLCWVILTLSNSSSSRHDTLIFMPSPVMLHHATYFS